MGKERKKFKEISTFLKDAIKKWILNQAAASSQNKYKEYIDALTELTAKLNNLEDAADQILVCINDVGDEIDNVIKKYPDLLKKQTAIPKTLLPRLYRSRPSLIQPYNLQNELSDKNVSYEKFVYPREQNFSDPLFQIGQLMGSDCGQDEYNHIIETGQTTLSHAHPEIVRISVTLANWARTIEEEFDREKVGLFSGDLAVSSSKGGKPEDVHLKEICVIAKGLTPSEYINSQTEDPDPTPAKVLHAILGVLDKEYPQWTLPDLGTNEPKLRRAIEDKFKSLNK